MYPQYWTPGIGGIFMRYSYEYKKMCVELYRQGKWVETPEGVKEKNFRNMIQIWARTEESCGVEALRHKNQNKVWTAEEKYELVAKVLAGESNRTTAIQTFRIAGRCLTFFPICRRSSTKTISGVRSKNPISLFQLIPQRQCCKPMNCCFIFRPQFGQILLLAPIAFFSDKDQDNPFNICL